MANPATLKPLNTRKDAREIQSKGGLAAAAARRERRLFRETVADILACPAKFNGKVLKDPTTGKPLENMQAAVVVSMLKEALNGDSKAAGKLVEWLGEANTPAGVTINVALGK